MVKSLNAFLLMLSAVSLELKAVTPLELRQADKVALALTGEPLSDDLRAKFVSGEMTLEQIADTLSKGEGFIEHFAAFYTRLLGIQTPVDVQDMKVAKNGRTIDSVIKGQDWNGIGAGEAKGLTKAKLEAWIKSRQDAQVELSVVDCKTFPLLVWFNAEGQIARLTKASKEGIGPNDEPILPDTQAAWTTILNIAIAGSAECTDNTPSVKPWWDPDTVTIHGRYKNSTGYKVAADVLRRCGPTMEKCSLRNAAGYDKFFSDLNRHVSMEPGYIIGHTVAEDRSFQEILTTTDTVMTGTYGYFMRTWGKDLFSNYPTEKIPDADNALFVSSHPLDKKHYRIDRGAGNAGILTTPAYQLATNGNRAKANRAYETFLCKKFVVPDGAIADPNDANPDLTKRTYCAFCHKSLEPMAAFFNRWPAVGTVEFKYNRANNVNDAGRMNGQEGQGAAAFGKIMSESEGFAECSVKRAFEFINGRKLSQIELEAEVPAWSATLKANNFDMRRIIKAMVLDPQFLNPQGGQP